MLLFVSLFCFSFQILSVYSCLSSQQIPSFYVQFRLFSSVLFVSTPKLQEVATGFNVRNYRVRLHSPGTS